jgi:hypothetical protein
MKKPAQSGALHIWMPLFVLVAIGLLFVAYMHLAHNNKGSTSYLIQNGFDATVYDRQGSPKKVADNVSWEIDVKAVPSPGTVFDDDRAGGGSYMYYLLGSDKNSGDRYYFAQQKPTESSDGSPAFASFAAFTADQIVFRAGKDGTFTVLSRMSPSLVDRDDLDIENVGGKGKDGTVQPVSKDRIQMLALAKGVRRDDDTVVASSAAPAEIKLQSGVTLNYRGLSYGDQPIVTKPVGSFTGTSTKKVQGFHEGVLYEFSKPEDTYKEKPIEYLLVLNDHTKAVYQVRNDFNYPETDQIVWNKGQKNAASFVSESYTSHCKIDRRTMDQDIVRPAASELVKAGTYDNGEVVYGLNSGSEYARQRYATYKKLKDFKFSKDVTQAGSIDEYLSKHPFYLVDSHQGYYYVYSDPSFIYGTYRDCQMK